MMFKATEGLINLFPLSSDLTIPTKIIYEICSLYINPDHIQYTISNYTI